MARPIDIISKQMRTFNPSFGLHQYLAKRKSSLITLSTSTYRPSTILLALTEIIQEEKLFDDGNHTIIVLNHELERIFGAKVFHVSQFRPQLEKLLYKKFGKEHTVSLEIANKEIEAINFWDSIEAGTNAQTDKGQEAFVIVKPELFCLLKNEGLLPFKAGRKMKIYRIQALVEEYIKRNVLKDARNSFVLNLRKNELGRLVGKDYATIPQVLASIRESCLIHLPEPEVRKSQRKLP